MDSRISAVTLEDIGDLVRKIDLPTMQDGPLYALMFPSEPTVEQQDQVVRWCTEDLADALQRGTDTIIQICDAQGEVVGFCWWTMGHSHLTNREALRPRKQWLPDTLDIMQWSSIASALRKERDGALEGLSFACSLNTLAVHPQHQRHGLGSRLLKYACREFDEVGCQVHVMSSPEGVGLYKKFGFHVLKEVDTRAGIFTSMIRQPAAKRKEEKQVGNNTLRR